MAKAPAPGGITFEDERRRRFGEVPQSRPPAIPAPNFSEEERGEAAFMRKATERHQAQFPDDAESLKMRRAGLVPPEENAAAREARDQFRERYPDAPRPVRQPEKPIADVEAFVESEVAKVRKRFPDTIETLRERRKGLVPPEENRAKEAARFRAHTQGYVDPAELQVVEAAILLGKLPGISDPDFVPEPGNRPAELAGQLALQANQAKAVGRRAEQGGAIEAGWITNVARTPKAPRPVTVANLQERFQKRFPGTQMQPEHVLRFIQQGQAHEYAVAIVNDDFGGVEFAPHEFGADRAMVAVQRVPESLRDDVLRAVQALSKAKAAGRDDNWAGRTLQAMGRGAVNIRRTFDEFIGSGGTEDDWRYFKAVRSAVGAGDPAVREDDNWFVAGSIRAGEQIIPMVFAQTSGRAFGAAAKAAGASKLLTRLAAGTGITLAMFPQSYSANLQGMEEAGVSSDTARAYSLIAATIEGAIEGITLAPFRGPNKAALAGAKGAMWKFAIDKAKDLAGEVTEEGLQEASNELIKTFTTHLDENAPDLDYGDIPEKALKALKDSIIPLLFLTGPSTVVGAARIADAPAPTPGVPLQVVEAAIDAREGARAGVPTSRTQLATLEQHGIDGLPALQDNSEANRRKWYETHKDEVDALADTALDNIQEVDFEEVARQQVADLQAEEPTIPAKEPRAAAPVEEAAPVEAPPVQPAAAPEAPEKPADLAARAAAGEDVERPPDVPPGRWRAMVSQKQVQAGLKPARRPLRKPVEPAVAEEVAEEPRRPLRKAKAPAGQKLRDQLPPEMQGAFDSLPEEIRGGHPIRSVRKVGSLGAEEEGARARYDQTVEQLVVAARGEPTAESDLINEVTASWAFRTNDKDLYDQWRKAAFPQGELDPQGFAGPDQADAFARSVADWMQGKASPEVSAVLDARFGARPVEPELQEEPAKPPLEKAELLYAAKKLGLKPGGLNKAAITAQIKQVEDNISEYAREHDIKPPLLQQAIEAVLPVERERMNDRREALKTVRDLTHLYPAEIRDIENAGRDHDSVPRFDEAVQEIETAYPGLLVDPQGRPEVSPADVLWDLLKQRREDFAAPQADTRSVLDAARGELERSGTDYLVPRRVIEATPEQFEEAQRKLDEAAREPTPEEAVELGKPTPPVAGIAKPLPVPEVAQKGLKSVAGFFRRFFTARGELPQEVYDAKMKKEGQIGREMNKLKFLAADFRTAVKKSLDKREFTSSDRERLNAVLRGEARLETVPAEVREPLQAMRDHIDALSRQLIASGIAQGELLGTITENLGVYATRSYRVFDDPKWREHVPEDVRNRALAFLRAEYPDKSDREIHGLLESLLLRGVEAGAPLALLKGAKLGTKDLGILMRRKDIPEPLRELWGEYKDAGVNYARSVFKMANLLANQRFLERVREAGMGRFLAKEPIVTENGELIAKLAADESSVMSPLNGLYTTPEIKAAFERAYQRMQMPSWLRIYMGINSAVKYSKTVGSAMTHVRNFISNAGFAVANGHWRIGKAKDAWMATITGLANLKDETWRNYYLRLVELKLVGEDVRAGELKDALRDASKVDIDEYLYNTEARHAKKIVRAGRKAVRITSALYQAEDGIWKAYAWENEKARYREARPEWSETQLEEHAAQIVRDTYPTYSKIGEGVKAIRRFPLVGTFVSFPAEVVRTTFNTLRIGVEEMKSPETRAIGASRLVGMTLALTGLSGLSWATMALVGVSPDDDEDLRSFVPPWQENSRFLYLARKAGGNIRYIDLGYSDPHAWITDAVVGFMRGESLSDSIAKAAEEFASPFVSEEILARAIRESVSNKTATGRQVYNPEDTAIEKAKAIGDHLWKPIEPGTITSAKRILKGLAGEVSQTGRAYDPVVETLAVLSGQRIQDVDVEQSLSFRIRDFKRELNDIQGILRRSVTRRGTVTGKQIEADRERMETLRKAKFSEMQRVLGAAHRLGVPKSKIVTMLKDEKLSEKVRGELLSGQYSPYRLSPETINRIREAAPTPEDARKRLDALRKKSGSR